MEITVSDSELLDKLRTSNETRERYHNLTKYLLEHGCAASLALTDPLTDSAKQFFESAGRCLPYVLLVDPDFLGAVREMALPDAAALKLQSDLPGIGFDAKAYILERNARIKAAEDAKKKRD
jgi:hypothetical protein